MKHRQKRRNFNSNRSEAVSEPLMCNDLIATITLKMKADTDKIVEARLLKSANMPSLEAEIFLFKFMFYCLKLLF